MSHGSIAEELGVRPGDVVDSVNGECVATTVEVIIINSNSNRCVMLLRE